MTTEEVRAKFDEAISQTTDKDEITKLEVMREYFTNPAFRTMIHNTVFEINMAK